MNRANHGLALSKNLDIYEGGILMRVPEESLQEQGTKNGPSVIVFYIKHPLSVFL